MGRFCRAAVVGLLLAASLLASPVLAHGIRLSAHVHGKTIHGEVCFQGDLPAKNVKVTAFDPSGSELAETITDEKGAFQLTVEYQCDYRLVADTGDGHGGELTIAADRLPGGLPTPGNGSESIASKKEQLEAISREIAALQKDLDAFRRKTYLRDVLGGIGYIVGVAGIAFYILGVRRKSTRSGE